VIGVHIYHIQNVSRRPNGDETRGAAGRDRRAHHSQPAGIRIDGEYRDVIGDAVGDVRKSPQGRERDDPGVRAAGWHRVFGGESARLSIDCIGGNAIGKRVGH